MESGPGAPVTSSTGRTAMLLRYLDQNPHGQIMSVLGDEHELFDDSPVIVFPHETCVGVSSF